MTSQHKALDGMTEDQKALFRRQYGSVRKDRTKIQVLSLFLGWSGVDRFMVDDIGFGLFKLFTLGGLGILWFVDIFLIKARVDQYNWRQADKIRAKILTETHSSDVDGYEVAPAKSKARRVARTVMVLMAVRYLLSGRRER